MEEVYLIGVDLDNKKDVLPTITVARQSLVSTTVLRTLYGAEAKEFYDNYLKEGGNKYGKRC